MEVESIEVVNSEGGNVPAEAPVAPADPTPAPSSTETPEVPSVDPVPPVAELFELPDGRKVDAVTLQSEWKENFYPEFTRRSQELAELKKGPAPEVPKSPYADPEYVPQSYEELIKAAEERVFQTIAQREEEQKAQQSAVENAVVQQLTEVKKIDPTVNENQLFLHANKYGFRDLSLAYQNMKDMASVVKTVQKNTAENIAKRNDPVSVAPGGSVGTRPDPSAFGSAIEYMRSLKT